MADNLDVTPGTGKTVGADEISSVLYQRIKLIHGADGVNAGDVSTANGLPVTPVLTTGVILSVDVAASALNASYQALAAAHDWRMFTYVNMGSTDVRISFDASGSDVIAFYVPAGQQIVIDFAALGVKIVTAIKIKGSAGTGTGYFTGVYV